jgi:Protein of unknown function (DUF3106)
MTLRAQIRQGCTWAGLMLALVALPSFAQNRRDQQRPVPRPNVQERRQERRDDRQQRREERRDSRPQFNREPARPAPQFQPAPRPQYRPYQPPTQGHHSGQWLNQQRERPLDQQRRALENDPAFRRLPRESQQKYEQRLQRFNSMPPDRQQQVLRRMETWEHLTPQQKQDFRGIGSQFNNLQPDRRRAVRNAIDTLRAMPPDARQREVQSGRFSQFSPQERQILNDAARLPLAPAPPDSGSSAPEQQNTGSQRYVPRPPR